METTYYYIFGLIKKLFIWLVSVLIPTYVKKHPRSRSIIRKRGYFVIDDV